MKTLARWLMIPAAALGAACADPGGSPTLTAPAGGRAQLSDGAHGGLAGFYFLPPVLSQPTTSGTFDADLSPRVTVCVPQGTGCGATVAEWTMTSGTDAERVEVKASQSHYLVNWDTKGYDVSVGDTMRIAVFVGTKKLGHADVVLIENGSAAREIDTNEYIPLVDGRTLPIKFRIETGVPATLTVTPATASVVAGNTQQYTATVKDLHGNTLTGYTFAWSSSNVAVAKVSSTGLAKGLDSGTVTVTATTGGLSGTAQLSVTLRQWTPAVTNTDQGNGGIWGSSASDVYAANWVGVLHFDGTSWSAVSALQWHGTLDVYGFSASDVYAVGPMGRILHFNGTAWGNTRYDGDSIFAHPLNDWDPLSRNIYLRGVWGSAGNDVFAVGDSGTVLHWNGSAWSKMTTGTTAELHRVWGTSGSNVYASGVGGTLLRYDGSSWSAVTVPTTESLERIWGSSASDLYVGGANGTLLHYNGSSWSTITTPINPTYTIFSIWGTSASNVFIAGSGGQVYRWDGADWIHEDSGQNSQILGLWGASASDVFAAAHGGNITRR
jgi:hypothetical protein